MPIQIFYTYQTPVNTIDTGVSGEIISLRSTLLNCLRNKQIAHNKPLGQKLLIETIKAISPNFETNELFYVNGQPQCRDAYLSLTYSNNIIVAAASKNKIGIDIECIVPIAIDQYMNEFCQEEKNFLRSANTNVSDFYFIWTRKEALLKACGYGLQYPLSDLNTLQTEVSLLISPVRWHLNSQIIDQKYMFSCAYESSSELLVPIELLLAD